MRAALTIALFTLFLAADFAGAAGTPHDMDFATKATQANLAEIATGRMAVEKATSADVKTFGQRMIDDHTKAGHELMAAAPGADLPTTPSKMQQAHAAMLDKKSGADFDRDYVKMAVKDHEEAVALFSKEAKSGKDENLRAFAQKTLPVLQTHLRMAREMAKGNMTGAHHAH